MSYCRFGKDSDAYVLGRMEGGYDVYLKGEDLTLSHCLTARDALAKLEEAKARGLKIPKKALDRLSKDQEWETKEGDKP